jgi:hypothetical protein
MCESLGSSWASHNHTFASLPPQPLDRMDPAFGSMISGLGIPENFVKFLETKRICDSESFALLAVDEKEIKSEIMAMAKADGVHLTEPSDQVAVKKLWLACRKTMTTNAGSEPSGAFEQDNIPKEVAIDMKAQWQRIHGFVIPDAWMLSSALQNKLWKAANAKPRAVEVVLMEGLRLLSQRTRATGTLLTNTPGKLSTVQVEIDSVYGQMEFFQRARAWFMTTAFVSIRTPAWFDLQGAIFAADKVLELLQITSRGQSPPMDHFINAWAATLHYFSEQVRITAQPLGTFVQNTGSWEHKWSWTASAASSEVPFADLPPVVANDVEHMRQQARQWQSMVDRQSSGNAGRDTGAGTPNKGGGKGNKGKKGNKFRYKPNLKPRDRDYGRGDRRSRSRRR